MDFAIKSLFRSWDESQLLGDHVKDACFMFHTRFGGDVQFDLNIYSTGLICVETA